MTVPSVEQEAARDLVRAREDVRGDLMRARHRLSKLLLRQGIVYSGGTAWTGRARRWLRAAQRRVRHGRAGSWRSTPPTRRCWPPRPAGTGSTRRSPRWPRTASSPRGAPAGLPARGLDPDRVRAGGRDRRLAPVHRQHHRRLPRAGAHRALLRAARGRRGRSPRPATPTPAGCWSRPPGTTAAPTAPARRCATAGSWHPRPPGPAAHAGQPAAAPPLGRPSPPARRRRVVANVAIARELAGWCWSLAVLE